MSEAPERIWIEDEFGEGDEDQWQYGTWDIRNHYGYIHPYTRADLARAQVAAVKVKPLVWEDFEGGHGAKAGAMLLSNYLIARRQDGHFEVAVSCPGYQAAFDGEPKHDTLEAAKAAAQSDYERRVFEVLAHVADANALVAAAYERAAGVVEKLFNDHTDDFIAEAIRTLTPDDAKAALDDMLKAERDRIAGLVMVLRAHDPETDFEKGFDAACVAVLREISALAQEGGE